MNRMIGASAMAGIVCLVATAACSAVDNRTQITVVLETETEIPKELTSFTLSVNSNTAGAAFYQVYTPKSGKEFPSTFSIVPASADSLDSPITVDIEGKNGNKVLIKRKAIVSYLKNRGLLLRMPLRMACYGQVGCREDQTCVGGDCVSPTVDASALREFVSTEVFGAGVSTCFNEDRCLASPQALAIQDDCTFQLPAGTTQNVGNVSVRWFDAPKRIIALTGEDSREGWVRVSASVGKLSDGVCHSYLDNRSGMPRKRVPEVATEVYFSSACPTHTAATPFCFSKLEHAGIGTEVP
jgi:hypothetical protein